MMSKKIKFLVRVWVCFGLFTLCSVSAFAKDGLWSSILNSPQRFQSLAGFQNQAVLDRETGLVWEQCPSLEEVYWKEPAASSSAVDDCYNKVVGGRMGWRLPSVEELRSLADTGVSQKLPHSAPFCEMDFGGSFGIGLGFWTSTTDVNSPDFALRVDGSSVTTSVKSNKETGKGAVWCVRGGQGLVTLD